MTDEVNPSGTRAADAKLTAGAMRYGGGDWIAPASKTYYADEASVDLSTPLDAFGSSHSGDSLTVTIGTGEAFVLGAWLGRDVSTDVQLADAVDNQVVYLGWAVGATNSVIIGTDSAFGADDPRMAIHEYDTDTNGVMAHRDVRALGEQIDVRNEGSTAQADHADHAQEAEQADNSDNLGGTPPSDYLRSDEPDTIHGRLDVMHEDANGGMRVENNGYNRSYLAPIIDGSVLGDSLLKYDDDKNHWLASGSRILRRAEESGLNVANSDNLGGISAGRWFRSDVDQTKTGRTNFVRDSEGIGWRVHANSSNASYIVPYQNGSSLDGNAILFEFGDNQYHFQSKARIDEVLQVLNPGGGNGFKVEPDPQDNRAYLQPKINGNYVQGRALIFENGEYYIQGQPQTDGGPVHNPENDPDATTQYLLEGGQYVHAAQFKNTGTLKLWGFGSMCMDNPDQDASIQIFEDRQKVAETVSTYLTGDYKERTPRKSLDGDEIIIRLENTTGDNRRVAGQYAYTIE